MRNRAFSGFIIQAAILISLSLLLCSPLFADMGAIYLHRDNVTVSEPAQKAVILHNGSEEILILETDLKASTKTDIMRFIPFPAEPRVSLAPENTLREIGKLVQGKKLQYVTVHQTKGGAGAQSRPVAEVISRAKLGAHDVTVVKINDARHFGRWVQDYFKDKKGLKAGPELAQIAKTATDYVKDGIVYFAFDSVTVDNDDKSVAPVAFRFDSKKVYYPLRTSNTIGGQGQIQLFFLAIDCVEPPYNYDFLQYFATSRPGFSHFDFSSVAVIKPEEADAVYPGAAAFFEEMEIVLQAASYSGPLQFEQDLNSFMLTHYDPSLYRPDGAVQNSLVGPNGFAPGWEFRLSGRLDPILNAEALHGQRQNLIAQLVNGSFHLKSAGRRVRFRDGVVREKAVRIEISRVAFGELNGDVVSDAAVLTRTNKRGRTCEELTVFAGKQAQPYEKPKLERAGSVLLRSCDVQGFSISDGSVRIRRRGGAIEIYKLRGGKLKLSAK